MALLLVTGRNAAEAVKRCAKSLSVPAVVRVCGVDVASFLTVGDLLKGVLGADPDKITGIIVPGNVIGDVSAVAKKTGIPCYKGPLSISDLPETLEKYLSGEIKLSTVVPADEIMQEGSEARMRRELSGALRRPGKYSFKIGKKRAVYLGAGGMGCVVAEINDAPLLSERELAEKAVYFRDSGAGIIDLGMMAGRDNSKKIDGIVKVVRSAVDIPLSIDSLDPKEIVCAVDAGIDLVLSVDLCNYGVFESLDVPAVVIPRDARGKVPAEPLERVFLVEKIMESLEGKKLIADMVLNPVNSGYAGSLQAYALFREKHPGVPMMLGAGNVTELLDADSQGVNALLAGYASEMGIGLLFTVEASPKTHGSVAELSAAARMMYLARKRGQAPKDLGLDLLVLKDKKKGALNDLSSLKLPVARALKAKDGVMEDSEFRIYVDRLINAVYYEKNKPLLRITGGSAQEVYGEILARKLTKDVSHASYLGKELSKAEIALRLGKSYIQDVDLF